MSYTIFLPTYCFSDQFIVLFKKLIYPRIYDLNKILMTSTYLFINFNVLIIEAKRLYSNTKGFNNCDKNLLWKYMFFGTIGLEHYVPFYISEAKDRRLIDNFRINVYV